MANPYGITEVNVPAALAVYQEGRRARLQDLLTQRQIQKEDRELQRQTTLASAYSKYFGGQQGGGDPASGGSAPSVSANSTSGAAGAAPFSGQSNPLIDPERRKRLIQEVATIDPNQAFDLIDKFAKIDDQQASMMKEHYGSMANFALHLRQFPLNERAAERARIAPDLRKAKFSDYDINNVDLSDNGLEYLINKGRDLEKIIEGSRPKVVPVQPGGTVYEQSPQGLGPDFNGQSSQGPQPGVEYNGYRFRGGNPNDRANWELIGGPGSGQGGFP